MKLKYWYSIDWIETETINFLFKARAAAPLRPTTTQPFHNFYLSGGGRFYKLLKSSKRLHQLWQKTHYLKGTEFGLSDSWFFISSSTKLQRVWKFELFRGQLVGTLSEVGKQYYCWYCLDVLQFFFFFRQQLLLTPASLPPKVVAQR